MTPKRRLACVALAALAPILLGTGAARAQTTLDPLAPTIVADTAFAPPTGIAEFDFTAGTATDVVGGVAVDGDRIYTIGETRDSTGNANIGIIARRTDGTFDTGFSEDGKHTIAIAAGNGRDAGVAIVVLPDHRLRLLAATDGVPGVATNLDVAVVGLTQDGSVDMEFGGGSGSVVFAVGAGNDTPSRLAVDSAGRLAISGTTVASSRDDFFVSLRQPDGSPAAFGVNGVRTFNRGGMVETTSLNDRGVDVGFRPGGGVIALLQVETNPEAALTDWHAVLHAFTEDGADDAGFSDDGDLDLPIGTPDTIPGGLLVHEDRLWLTGSTKSGPDTDAFLVRLDAAGAGFQERRFDMRGGLISPEQAVTSHGTDLAVLPGLPPTLVVVGSMTSDVSTDWAAAAFNGIEGDLEQFKTGDLVLPTPGEGAIVGVAPSDSDWLAVAGSLRDPTFGDTSFGGARLRVDVEKKCDLSLEILAPLEVAFEAGRPADLQLRVTNNGTKACAGLITVPAPYQLLTQGAAAPVSTGVLAPRASMSTTALSLAYNGPRRRDDLISVRVAAVGDDEPTNDARNLRVLFRFCDLRLSAGAAGVAPNEGEKEFTLTVSNIGTSACRRAQVAVAQGGTRSGEAVPFTVMAGRSFNEDVRIALDLANRRRPVAQILLRARADEDVDSGNDSLTLAPAVVDVGDSDARRVGRRVFAGTAKGSRSKRLSRRGRRVRRVEIAVQQIRTRPGCRWLASATGRLRTLPAAPYGACNRRIWLRTRGTTRWLLRLRRSLPRGRYVIYSRATIAAGFSEANFSRRDRNRISFRVR